MSNGSSSKARLLAVTLAFIALPAVAETFTLDSKKSELMLRIWREGLASAFAHNHLVRATEASGEITWDPQRPESAAVEITIAVNSLVADEPALRRRYGETSQLSESDRRKVNVSMFGPQQLDARRYATIRFVSTGAQKDEKGRIILSRRGG